MELNSNTNDTATQLDIGSKKSVNDISDIFVENSLEKTLQNALEHGIQGHKNGHLDVAAELYKTILEIDPNHAHANHRMGLLKIDTANDTAALPYLENAIISNCAVLEFWESLTKTLVRLGQLEEAEKIISLAKDYGANDEGIKTLEAELNQ